MSALHLAIASDFTLAEKLLEVIESQDLPFEQISAVELEPFGEEQSLRLGSKSVPQISLDEVDWSQFSHVLFAGKMSQAEQLAKIAQAGCTIIDLYGVTALIETVPVIVPSVNDDKIAQMQAHKIVALANPQVSQLALALKPLLNQPLEQIFVTSLLSSAYFGEEKIRQLAGQTAHLLNGIPLDEEDERVAFDVVPSNVQRNEKNLPFSKVFADQLVKVLPNLTASVVFHSVQVPVFYGLSQMVSVKSMSALNVEQLNEAWQTEAWLAFNQEDVITAVKNGENEEQNQLQISQLLQHNENGVQFWTVADEQRFDVAFLGIKLLESLLNY